jgi:hypothetical protein
MRNSASVAYPVRAFAHRPARKTSSVLPKSDHMADIDRRKTMRGAGVIISNVTRSQRTAKAFLRGGRWIFAHRRRHSSIASSATLPYRRPQPAAITHPQTIRALTHPITKCQKLSASEALDLGRIHRNTRRYCRGTPGQRRWNAVRVIIRTEQQEAT